MGRDVLSNGRAVFSVRCLAEHIEKPFLATPSAVNTVFGCVRCVQCSAGENTQEISSVRCVQCSGEHNEKHCVFHIVFGQVVFGVRRDTKGYGCL